MTGARRRLFDAGRWDDPADLRDDYDSFCRAHPRIGMSLAEFARAARNNALARALSVVDGAVGGREVATRWTVMEAGRPPLTALTGPCRSVTEVLVDRAPRGLAVESLYVDGGELVARLTGRDVVALARVRPVGPEDARRLGSLVARRGDPAAFEDAEGLWEGLDPAFAQEVRRAAARRGTAL